MRTLKCIAMHTLLHFQRNYSISRRSRLNIVHFRRMSWVIQMVFFLYSLLGWSELSTTGKWLIRFRNIQRKKNRQSNTKWDIKTSICVIANWCAARDQRNCLACTYTTTFRIAAGDWIFSKTNDRITLGRMNSTNTMQKKQNTKKKKWNGQGNL